MKMRKILVVTVLSLVTIAACSDEGQEQKREQKAEVSHSKVATEQPAQKQEKEAVGEGEVVVEQAAPQQKQQNDEAGSTAAAESPVQEQKYKEDVNYRKVVPEQPGAEGNKILVMEFFMYGCGHCNHFEPYLQKWLQSKPADVEFVKVPAMFDRPEVIMHAKTFYALNQIGAEQDIHSKIFHAMHKERRYLSTQEEMESFLQENGVNLEEYRKAMKSFDILTNSRRAAVLAEDYAVHGVPALAVDGKYVIGGQDGDVMTGTLDQLIEQVRRAKDEGKSGS
jgi:thiol:disulfide interchange protein DsbA